MALTSFSSDNQENYPRDISIESTYTLSEKNELITKYNTTTEDTIINLTGSSFDFSQHKKYPSKQTTLLF